MSLLGRLAAGLLGAARPAPALSLRSLWTVGRLLPSAAPALTAQQAAPAPASPLLAASTAQVSADSGTGRCRTATEQ